jgi:lipoyl-dependent peroxiredoxin
MNKFASAHWEGDIKKGNGTISTQSGALKEQPYGFNTRFEDEPGTNPEELIGAAHAGCFSMAFSLELGNAGYTADSIDTKAKVTLDKEDEGFSITKVHLDMTAKIPGIADSEFQDIAKAAKEGCPVSKVLNADITLEAKLQE